jgi:tRNA(adenine34) deaminase
MYTFPARDQHWMKHALALAEQAQSQQEIPVGAVVILDEQMIGEGSNQSIQNNDPTAHAEIIALRQASQHLNNYRLLNATLYVTLEPCMMCVGALLHARIKRLVFGALDPKTGAIASAFHLLDNKQHNHSIEWEGGCLAELCSQQLTRFFQQRR